MSDDNQLFDLTRRKMLGSIGALGVGAALGGAGTAAFFSDEETFTDNTLTAGSLDLVVDWEEHYFDGDVSGVEYTYAEPDGDGYVGLPDPNDPMVWVDEDDLEAFMDATSIEAYPDSGDDGIQDDLTEYVACDDFAQLDENMDPTNGRGAGKRTDNDDTVVDGEVAPLVNLQDVKPGDFGELTLSTHLCDNPGYLWLQGQLIDAAENGVTEPESKDPDEKDGVVELLDSVQTKLWYDEDGDNVFEPGGVTGEVDVVLVIDESGSMDGSKLDEAKSGANALIDALELDSDAGQVGVVSFDDGGDTPVTLRQGLTTNAAVAKEGVADIPEDGGYTNMEAGVLGGHEELMGDDSLIDNFAPSGNHRADAEKIMVFLGDGQPNRSSTDESDNTNSAINEAQAAKDAGIEIYTIGYDVPVGGTAEDELIDMADDPDHYYRADTGELEQVFAQISQIIAGEEAFFTGSLRELLDRSAEGVGIPLDGNRTTQFDELTGDPTDEAREEFVDSTTNNIGLAWWVPVDHANEIQTDSVSFNLGFYTEQSRHNDGAGLQTVRTATGEGWANEEENFNGDGTMSSFARARYGGTNTWELAVGDDTSNSAQADYSWTSGQTVDWSYEYDADAEEAAFTLDGTSIGPYALADQPDGRMAIQTKADEATVSVENLQLAMDGDEQLIEGPDAVTASNDDDGGDRDLQYVVMDTALDGESSFSLSGTVTVTLQNDYDTSAEEGVAFDVALE